MRFGGEAGRLGALVKVQKGCWTSGVSRSFLCDPSAYSFDQYVMPFQLPSISQLNFFQV